MRDFVSIKGGREGLRIYLDDVVEWESVLAALRTHLDQGGNFFAGARLVLDVGERALSEQQLAELLSLMQQYGLRPETLAATARASRNAARSAGLTARVALPSPSGSPGTPTESEATLVIRTVRSGQIIRHPGHVSLIGDVNPGAEVIAGGSVIVWGRLRGVVHAGAMGDSSALICAIELRPTQLRIGTLIARTPEDGTRRTPLPEVARVDLAQGRIIVEAWDVKF